MKWTKKKELAALLVAQDELTDTEIAAQVGVVRDTVMRWKRAPEFRSRVEGILTSIRQAIVARGISERQNRIDAYNERWLKLRQVIDARATDPLMKDVAGGHTGLLVASPVLVKCYEAGTGETLTPMKQSIVMYEYAVDTGLLKEMRETEKQAAIELGEWQEKMNVSGQTLIREYGVPLEEV